METTDDIPPRPSPHHEWSGWWWCFAQDVPRGSTPASWLVGWLPTGHRHLWLAQEVVPGIWLEINPASTRFVARVFDDACFPGGFLGTMAAAGMTGVRVGHWIDSRRPWLRGLLTCVAVAKMTTGARWLWVQIPRGFIRRAEREGFEIRRQTA